MLVTNQCLDKLAAARVDFKSRGMLNGTCLLATLQVSCELYVHCYIKPGHVCRNCLKKNGAGKSSYGKNTIRREVAKDETAKGGKSKIEEIEDSNEESDEEEMQVDRIRRIRVQKGKAKDF